MTALLLWLMLTARVRLHQGTANGLDVLRYLNYVFRTIPMADGNLTDVLLESLMPWN